MTMNGHGISGGEHGGMNVADLMVPGAGRSGLDRRRLLGGVAAGAAALLLSGQAATAGNRAIRFDVINGGDAWPNVKLLVRGSPTKDMWLNQGQQTTIKSYSGATEPDLSIMIQPGSEVIHNVMVYVKNPLAGPPELSLLFSSNGDSLGAALKEGQSVTEQVPGTYRGIRVTRNDDTDDFKVYTIELTTFGKEGGLWPPPRPPRPMQSKDDKDDKKDNNDNNDNNKRPRKRGGGGGLNDVDQREHPVERVLD